MDAIVLKGMRFFSHVGVFEEEKQKGQVFEFDLECFFSAHISAVETDCLDESVSYADIYEVVKATVEPARFDLIEHLAGQVIRAVFERFPLDRVRLTVKKPNAPIDGEFDYMGVVIERTRHEKPVREFIAYVGLGGNLGDRQAILTSAVSRIADHPSIRLSGVSSLYETAPWGVENQPDFLNAVIRLDTTLNPFDLLGFLQDVEREHGRERLVRWGPRTLDLDIIRIDDLTIDSPELQIPHPRLKERNFVLIPLAELTGDQVVLDASVRFLTRDWYCSKGAETLE